jgi:Type IV secretion-system coupling protein DNA-binding domain
MSILKIKAAKENERGPFYMEPVLAVLHSLQEPFDLEIGVHNSKIALFVRGSSESISAVQSQIYAQYPDIEIEELTEDPTDPKNGETKEIAHLTLDSPEVYPIKRHSQFDDAITRLNVDPIAGITSALTLMAEPEVRGYVRIRVVPQYGGYRRRALKLLPLLQKGLAAQSGTVAMKLTRYYLAKGFTQRLMAHPLGAWKTLPILSKLFTSVVQGVQAKPDAELDDQGSTRSHDREDATAGALDKLNRLLFSCTIEVGVLAPVTMRKLALQQRKEIIASFRQFTLPHSNSFEVAPVAKKPPCCTLSVEEVATLWHLPTILVQTPNIDWVMSKKLEPPSNLPPVRENNPDGVTTLGQAVFRGKRTTFGIKLDDRRRHVYIIGKTGMGKSTLLQNMIYADIQSGKGVAVIDPHGDLIESALTYVPKERNNDVILFDPSDLGYPLAFNVLSCENPDQYAVTASGIMSVFKKLWPDAFSGRMEHILRNCLLALLEYKGSSMLGIMRMFTDDAYRKKVVDQVTNPMVVSFWNDEYATWSEKYRTEAIAAIQNKVGQLLSTPLIRNIVGQSQSKLDIRHAMDTGKIILVNLSKGKIGEDTSAFLGSMLVTKFQIDAMSRADIEEKDRRDFFLYVDEFQNFATESFATILSEARKYRLSLTMANQYVSQLMIGDNNSSLRDAVFGNVGSLVSFQVGSDDAEILSLQFEEYVTAKDILSLPKYHAYMRVMIDGMPSKPFSVSTLPPPDRAPQSAERSVLQQLTRDRYGQKRDIVEDKIRQWTQSASEGKVATKVQAKQVEKEEEEKVKARKKGMTLDEYRVWRDKELWTNDFNALRKRHLLENDLRPDEVQKMHELAAILEKNGGVPPISKGLIQLIEKKKTGE